MTAVFLCGIQVRSRFPEESDLTVCCGIFPVFFQNLHFSDIFAEPVDIPGVEWGTIYSYYDTWKNLTIDLTGRILE